MVIHDYFISVHPTKALNTSQVTVINQKYKYILGKIELVINPSILLHINTFSVVLNAFPSVTV